MNLPQGVLVSARRAHGHCRTRRTLIERPFRSAVAPRHAMNQSGPLLTSSSTILWLKVLLTAGSLALLYLRYVKRRTSSTRLETHARGTKAMVVLAVLFSFAVFHSFGHPRSDTFVHYGEMFHYYLGPKYFEELGHYDLYNAVIAADAEQDGALAGLPFYTDLKSYQNATRDSALRQADRVRARFSAERWRTFKDDVSFFKSETKKPGRPGIHVFLMDHGYNASPVSTLFLGTLANLVPVAQLKLLALLDVVLVAAMIALVFRTFGLPMGALFSVYFFVNILNDHGYISGGFLRYDWLFCVVAAVCLLEQGRHATGAFFLTAAAMLKVFPAVLFYGVGVTIFQRVRTARALDRASKRFVVAAGATCMVLFLLPAAYLGSVVQPWEEFGAKTALHDRGVYVNHLGLRGVLLFEPSHLSLDRFVAAYQEGSAGDIVRHWQDIKEYEYEERKPVVVVCALLVLVCLTAIIWKQRLPESESVLWPLLLIYVASYPSHYYYAFLCLFILLFFRRPASLASFVPICLLLVFNIAALVTDYFGPSPIAFYTLVNGYLFVCMTAILGFTLYDAFGMGPGVPAALPEGEKAQTKRARSKRRQKTLRRVWTA